jgi:hypothetical protein
MAMTAPPTIPHLELLSDDQVDDCVEFVGEAVKLYAEVRRRGYFGEGSIRVVGEDGSDHYWEIDKKQKQRRTKRKAA